MIQDAIRQAAERKDLSTETAHQVMREMMEGVATQSQIGSFLTAMRMKGETEDEIRGFVVAMREAASRISSPPDAIDMCGTGGDGAGTFNISTVASFVVAGAGVAVAKHGNRSVSSMCGSADLLAALGVPYDLPPMMVQECLDSCGLGFMFAPVFHQSMKNVIGPRREVGLRTFFNLLGPMTNPAGVRNQLIGVYDPSLGMMMARVLRDLGTKRLLVVNGSGTDECTTTGKTRVVDLRDDSIKQYDIEPGMFGIDLVEPNRLRGGDALENGRIALRILKGDRSPRADVVALNAAAGLYVSGKAETIEQGLEMARDAISSGRALRKAREFADVSLRLDKRRQLGAPAASLLSRRVHPDVLKSRAREITEHLVSEISATAAGRDILAGLDAELVASPNVLSAITLSRIKSLIGASATSRDCASRSGRRLSDSIKASQGVAVIAEYKSRSPTSGPLLVPPDPRDVATAYSSAGVAGVSVVVEPEFFSGSAELFSAMRAHLCLPMLFKDFVVGEAQIELAYHLGADAVLLISKALRTETLGRLATSCISRGMEPLVEVHDEADLKKVKESDCYGKLRMIGVNSRDLRTLETDLTGLASLRAQIQGAKLTIAESGVAGTSDVASIAGFDAVLVGNTFMRAEDLDSKVREFVNAFGGVAR